MIRKATHGIKRFGHSTFSSLKIRNYRLYFVGQGISLCGTWMQTIGQAWLVLELTGSGTALGLVTALQFLPILILGPLGGVVADRFSKRKILFMTQTTAGILAAILGILVVTHTVQLWMVYALAAALGLVGALDNPTRQTFIFEMAGGDEIGNAITLNSMEVNLARIIGPAVAGVIIASIGLALCFFINAASYAAVLVCLLLMSSRELHKREPVKRAKGQLREGFRYVRHTPLLFDVLTMLAIVGTLTYEFQISLALLAKYTFRGNASAYALLTSAMGLGAVIGGLATAGRKRTSPQGLVGIVLALGATIILAAVSPSLPLAAFAMVLVGICSIRFTSLGNTILQLESAPQMRSRVMALWTVAFLGSTPIGGPIIGWIGEHANARWGLATGGLAAIAAGILGAITLKKYASHTFAESRIHPASEK